MTKKVAVINDLSGFGKCSLTAAVSVIAAMGVQPCPLPTAVLSAQTGYQSYYYDDYTDRMELIFREWEKMRAHFDGICTGFMSGEEQIRKVLGFLEIFYKEKETFLLVDPVMGDNGQSFSFLTPEFRKAMKELALRADVITPNLTELCILTGRECRLVKEKTDKKELLDIAEEMARIMMDGGTKEVVVTGICYEDEKTGRRMMGNYAVTQARASFSAFPFEGGSFSGTGDLFAAVITGGKARGDRLEDSMYLAGEMIGMAVKESVRNHVPRNEGVDYEQYLWMLTEKNRKK